MSLSPALIAETERVLRERPHIRRCYHYTDDDVSEFSQSLHRSFSLVTGLPDLTGIVRDPNDDMVIATALKAHAAYIVTRDDDLLSLGQYENITILTPEAFMGLLREQGRVR